MARLLNRTTIIPPQVDHNQLVEHLITVDRNALHLTSIYRGNVYFKSRINYPVSSQRIAVYIVNAYIPITDDIFNQSQVEYVYPSRIVDSVSFTFDYYKS